MKRTQTLGAALLGTVLLATTGCGSDPGEEFAAQSVKKIEAQVKKDMKSLKSMTMDGTLTSGGTKISLKLSADTDGNCTGTFGQGKGTADILSVGGENFLKADEEFWKAQAGDQAGQITALLGDKWAKLPGSANQFEQFCDLDKFIDEINTDDGSGDKVTKGELEDVNGVNALKLTSDGKDGKTNGWVAAEGKHYFVRMQKQGSDQGTFDFSDFNEPVKAKKPAADEVVDMSSLG